MSASNKLFAAIAGQLGTVFGEQLRLQSHQRVGGGDINEAFSLNFGCRSIFLKCNTGAPPEMFESEAQGLTELAESRSLLTPGVLAHGCLDQVAWLAMEFLEMNGSKQRSASAMGAGLARLHRQHQPYFGWHRDNFIGLTPQVNQGCDEWLLFYAQYRLRSQVDRLINAGAAGSLAGLCASLIDRMPELFEGYRVQPSLVHGDLWGGNWAATKAGKPVIFDPACYYGDRETDLAMSELFGGFPAAFYQSYEQSFPISPGYPQRRPLYQLYHVLNHANLFGGGYLTQARQMMRGLISDRNQKA